jgi:hypothetical protein
VADSPDNDDGGSDNDSDGEGYNDVVIFILNDNDSDDGGDILYFLEQCKNSLTYLCKKTRKVRTENPAIKILSANIKLGKFHA